MQGNEETIFKEWAILELMGHRRLAGLLTEVQIGGASFLRIDIPDKDGKTEASQLYAPGAVYCITPTSKEIAIAVAATSRPEPVSRWELQLPEPVRRCRVCGCTENNACIDRRTGEPCHWVEADLCSNCVEGESSGN
ncbi:MAG: hypothetical protein PHU08_00095 [Dehalococcoidales bacterium]|nr:hypothetical protein [Dehalococcoidales bacterium]